ncbi:MAG: DUF368 domain-containing protein [Clostridia bacterium]|nr:DUF368 domain-containing protein [Clostridia bacterium]
MENESIVYSSSSDTAPDNTKDTAPDNTPLDGKGGGIKGFFADVIRGALIGIAFIIPGFSGGSIAAIIGIYEKLIEAISGIFKHFKESIKALLPIAIGMVAGIIALLFPLGWALEAYPIPTVCLFVGLALGGMPSITEKTRGKIKWTNIIALLIPFAFAFCLSFLPIGEDVNLFGLSFGEYLLLFVIGIVGSSALVVPGISGSMLLLILGYYNPIVNMLTDHLLRGQDVGTSLLVLGSVGAGIAFGFIGISVIMKYCLTHFPRGTYFAIIGFIVGSIPTVFVSTAKDAGLNFSNLPTSPLYWCVSALLLIAGIALSLSLVLYSRKKGISE